jgi:hypothetical protein
MATPTTLPATFVAGNVLTAAQMNNLRGAFRILQVVSTAKTDAFTSTSTTFVDVTGLTVSITPSATSSKILLVANVQWSSGSSAFGPYFKFAGGNSGNYVGDTAGNRVRTVFGQYVGASTGTMLWPSSMVYLDSPSTTSPITYSVQTRTISGNTGYVNRSATDTDNEQYGRGASSITALEISA